MANYHINAIIDDDNIFQITSDKQGLEVKLGLNFVQEIREERLMSKAELARKAGVCPVTIDRVERGKNCRMETKRKIILALGFELSDKDRIFSED
jgi:DNA-binding XRE family transcriptional regulator